jgi:hypothetical protein
MSQVNERPKPPTAWAAGLAGLRAGAESQPQRNTPAPTSQDPARQTALFQAVQSRLGETARSVVAPLLAPASSPKAPAFNLGLPTRFDTPQQQQQAERAATRKLVRLEQAWAGYAQQRNAPNRRALNDALADARNASQRDGGRWSEATQIRSASLQEDAAQLLAFYPHDGQKRDRLNPETVGTVTNINPDTGEETVTQVQLTEQLLVTSGFTAKGPQVVRGDEKLLELDKTYRPKDINGKLIVDREQAKAWVTQQIRDRGISSLTEDQQHTKAFFEARRIKANEGPIAALAASLPQRMQLGMVDITPKPPRNPDLPNIWRGPAHSHHAVERGANWHTRTVVTEKPSLKAGIIVVPNIVITLPFAVKKGQAPEAFTFTVQPLDLFVPLTGSLPGYKSSTETTAYYTETVHPAGDYYGDKSARGQTWKEYYQKDPTYTTAFRMQEILGKNSSETKNFHQEFFNAPIAVAPWINASLHARAVPVRYETNFFGSQVNDFTDGTQSYSQVFAPYSWTQLGNVKFTIGNLGHPGPKNNVVAGHAGIQFEVGVYLVNVNQTLSNQRIEPPNPHIVNGKVELDRRKWEQQFEKIRKELGFDLRSESVLPDVWGDKVASVFWRVPDLDINFGNPKKWAQRLVSAVPPDAQPGDYLQRDGKTTQVTAPHSNRFPTIGREDLSAVDQLKKNLGMEVHQRRYISAKNLAAMLVEAGNLGPQYRELQYVTPEALIAANKDQVKMIIDPTTGKREPSLEVGSYVNTSLLVTTDRPGLFVQERNLPPDLIDLETSKLNYALPHWLNHLTPDGNRAHVDTPKTRQDAPGRKIGTLLE